MDTVYRCESERRRQAVLAADPPTVNGIDFIEVAADHTTLTVAFLHDLPGSPGGVPAGPPLTVDNVVIEGGTRISGIRVTSVATAAHQLTVTVAFQGDFSAYTLRLRRSAHEDAPPAGFDPRLSQASFWFRADCPSEFDCRTEPACPPEVRPEPDIDYLAKDYDSFRRLMLDRMSTMLPAWRTTNPADLLVTLVELLAYAGDHLSYFQDSVATEAYLGTARRRISVRRHARLLDYRLHEGCNARAWVVFEVTPGGTGDGAVLEGGTLVLTGRPHAGFVLPGDPAEALAGPVVPPDLREQALAEGPVPFETMEPVTLRSAHNRIVFHTWSDEACCLPVGSTRATLVEEPGVSLAAGDVILLEEDPGPSGSAAAAVDPTHRQAVRLTAVEATVDPLRGIPIIEVEWAAADALTFPLCISAMVEAPGGGEERAVVGVVSANVALAHHGRRIADDALLPGVAPDDGPYRPRLSRAPLSFVCQYDRGAPAAAAFGCDPSRAAPDVTLAGEDAAWSAVPDLLGSDAFGTDFTVEMDDDGVAHLRFGDGEHGRSPRPASEFTADYRIGNGSGGNVGAESITRLVHAPIGIAGVRNPLPALGGKDPEPLERVRQHAPFAFRTQERAVTEADYAEVGARHPGVQRAAGRLRWTGSWYTAFVTVDRLGGTEVDDRFREDMVSFLDGYRMAGVDVEVGGPVQVPLDIALEVCVKPGYFRADVAGTVLRALGSASLPDGRRGLFHPDNFTFGQPVFLSQILRAVADVGGVRAVRAIRFQRWGKLADQELAEGVLRPAPLEVVRLDNDPNFPENGRLELVMDGGL